MVQRFKRYTPFVDPVSASDLNNRAEVLEELLPLVTSMGNGGKSPMGLLNKLMRESRRTLVNCVNTTASTIPRFGIRALSTTPVIPLTNDEAFAQVMFNLVALPGTITDSTTVPIAVAQEPISPNQSGLCCMYGLTWAFVDLTAGHNFIKPPGGGNQSFTSASNDACGRIIWRESTSGVGVRCVVMLNQGGGGTSDGSGPVAGTLALTLLGGNLTCGGMYSGTLYTNATGSVSSSLSTFTQASVGTPYAGPGTNIITLRYTLEQGKLTHILTPGLYYSVKSGMKDSARSNVDIYDVVGAALDAGTQQYQVNSMTTPTTRSWDWVRAHP